MTDIARQPAGTPIGGRFAPTGGADAGMDLGTPERVIADEFELATCNECGEDMTITKEGVSHHVTGDGTIDYDADGEHVAVVDPTGRCFDCGETADSDDDGNCLHCGDPLTITGLDLPDRLARPRPATTAVTALTDALVARGTTSVTLARQQDGPWVAVEAADADGNVVEPDPALDAEISRHQDAIRASAGEGDTFVVDTAR